MNCFAAMSSALDQIQVSSAKFKPKSRPRCSMLVFKGYEKCQGDGAESKVRAVWRGCNGHRQHGLDICAVHVRSLMRQQRNAATLIQSIARRNRAKKFVGCLKRQDRDVVMNILYEVRNLRLGSPHPKRSKHVPVEPLIPRRSR